MPVLHWTANLEWEHFSLLLACPELCVPSLPQSLFHGKTAKMYVVLTAVCEASGICLHNLAWSTPAICDFARDTLELATHVRQCL